MSCARTNSPRRRCVVINNTNDPVDARRCADRLKAEGVIHDYHLVAKGIEDVLPAASGCPDGLGRIHERDAAD